MAATANWVSHCQAEVAVSSFQMGRSSANCDSTPSPPNSSTSRPRLKGAKRSQDQSIRASGTAGAAAAAGAMGWAGPSGDRSSGRPAAAGAACCSATARRVSSVVRSAWASAAARASSVMRSSSTPVPICTFCRPRMRWSRDASRSTLRTRSSGAVEVLLLRMPLRTWIWVPVRR